MNAAAASAFLQPSGATELRARAAFIARRVVASLPPAERTVAARVIAARFVERLATSLAVGDEKLLTAWVGRAVERYAVGIPAALIVASTMAHVAAEDFGGAVPAAELARIRAQVEAIVSRPRLLRAAVNHDVVDEVDVVLDALLNDLDRSDELTAEHSRAVSSWCARLGQRLGLERDDVRRLRRAGLIHDIGKVKTPRSILTAPRRLNAAEMQVMQRHAAAGAEIVSGIPLIAHLLPGVRNHHERFDGAGYPDGLAALSIPSEARIVAVADAFNAMIGRRPYRPPLVPSEALERLCANRGSQFDPDVVDAMVDVVTGRTTTA